MGGAVERSPVKGNSKSIWHGKHWEDLTSDQRKLVLPMMKNYIETEGPVTRVESIFILISVEIFKIDITAAYLNTPMNEDMKHKWLMLGKDVASIFMCRLLENLFAQG